MKTKVKAVMLIIASSDEANDVYFFKKIKKEHRPYFPFMKRMIESYMNENENIKVFFVYGDSGVKESEHDLVYDIKENDYPGIITKTLFAMKDVLEMYEFDHLIRTNLSTFWDMNLLEARLDSLPKVGCMAATPVKFEGLDKNVYEYLSGFDLIFSRDLIQTLADNMDIVLNTNVYSNLEDLTLYTACKNLTQFTAFSDYRNSCVTAVHLHQYDLTRRIQKQRNADHIRIKNSEKRDESKIIMQRLVQDVYGKTIL